jgi:ubiquinone/menaquinone biosynthesis C-methylase UbiE
MVQAQNSSPYSTSQMDNFYEVLAQGRVKPSAIMNYLQHLFVAERCNANDVVLDIGCGRGLLVPLLKEFAPEIREYTGVDISEANLSEAEALVSRLGRPLSFRCSFIHGDVTQLSTLVTDPADIVVYTSALEHLPRDAGIRSLSEVAKVLSRTGTLYLSTPRTSLGEPTGLQHKVHIYEWDRLELEAVLEDAGLRVVDCIGLLPPRDSELEATVESRFGSAGGAWFREMRRSVPHAFLAPVVASCFPDVASELLYVCKLGDSP